MTREISMAGAASTWLVVVDMQQVFADPASPWAAPGFDAILDNVRALAGAFGEQVVFTRFVAPSRPQGAWLHYYERWPFALVADDDPIYAIVAAVPSLGRPIVSRPTFGKWDEQPGSLRSATRDAQTLVLAGVSTDCCVLSTALAAADDGVRVQVVDDACAGMSERDHERALDAMRLYAPLVSVVSTAQVLGRGGTAS